MLVGTSGKITGKVSAEIVDVHGEVNDTLNASKALILRASGRVEVDDMQPLRARAGEVHRDRRRVVRIDSPLVEIPAV